MFTNQVIGVQRQTDALPAGVGVEFVSTFGNCQANLRHNGQLNLEWPTSADDIPPDFNFETQGSLEDFVAYQGLNINAFVQNAPLVILNQASQSTGPPQGGQFPGTTGGFGLVVLETAYIREIFTDHIWYSGSQDGVYNGTPNMCWDEVEVPYNLSYDPVACTMSWETRTIRVMVPCESTGGAGTDVTQTQGDDTGGGTFTVSGPPNSDTTGMGSGSGGYYYN